MKARVKATGDVVEVHQHDTMDDCWVHDYSNVPFSAKDLEFNLIDWEAYRREVAKEYITHAGLSDPDEVEWYAEIAVMAADALIARLKEQKGGEE